MAEKPLLFYSTRKHFCSSRFLQELRVQFLIQEFQFKMDEFTEYNGTVYKTLCFVRACTEYFAWIWFPISRNIKTRDEIRMKKEIVNQWFNCVQHSTFIFTMKHFDIIFRKFIQNDQFPFFRFFLLSFLFFFSVFLMKTFSFFERSIISKYFWKWSTYL